MKIEGSPRWGWAGRALGVGVGVVTADILGVPFRCPFHAATGLWCAGCGGTRAARALARFDVVAALDAHPLVVAAVPALVVLLVSVRLRSAASRFVHRRPVLIFAALSAFAIARNIPVDGAALLAPSSSE